MSKATLFKEETGETWSLETYHDCVHGYYLAPGAKKPKLTRVPKQLCTDGDPDKHVEAWKETLKGQGYTLKEDDSSPADPEVKFYWTIEGAVEPSWLPADMREIHKVHHGLIQIPSKSGDPIAMIKGSKETRGDGRRPMTTGAVTNPEDLIVLFRLAKSLAGFGVEVLTAEDSNQPDRDGAALVISPTEDPEWVANRWPDLRPKLEEHDLVKVSVRELEKPSKNWFF